MFDFFVILLLTTIGSLLGLIGGISFLYLNSWSQWLAKYSVPFAAGVLLTVSIMGLIPEAFETLGENAFLIILLSFLGAFLFEHLAFGIHHHDHHGHHHKHARKNESTKLIIIGDTIHNFIDGVTIASAYIISPQLGWVAAFSTLLHEIPHEISDFGILLTMGWKKKHILWVNIFSALATIVGGLFVYFVIRDSNVIGYLLSISAGIFLYLGASDFLPQVEDEDLKNNKFIFTLITGVLVMLMIFKIVPHAE